MVSTRGHPREFPAPTASPTKSARTTPAPTSSPSPSSPRPVTSSITLRASSSVSGWAHTPSNLTLLWLAVSVPLVIWDSGYVFLRPHSMPGGKYQWPLWKPYELYTTVDYIYGWPAYNNHNGFTAAQGSLNVVETVGYMVYLWIVYSYGQQEAIEGRGAPEKSVLGKLAESRTVYGRMAGIATLLAFSTALMTLSKTVLYWLNEAFSGFENIGHNNAVRLVFLWIIPNGLWIVLPSYMLYVFGAEILEGLNIAAADEKKSQ